MTNFNYEKEALFNAIGLTNMDHRTTLVSLINTEDELEDYFYNFYEGIGSNLSVSVQRFKMSKLGDDRVFMCEAGTENNDSYYLLR
ncbi:hypothetical protein JOC34_000852 [Virgibacillus halotolerans]|uniref:hypothetical protein n=1 Tax=Virgibacillus halotolerans TaxID=1071053 RepID=UPI00195FC8AB|nr:hypothetical protein [Virgibacillus halotolerans]MBM7598495.1 hypothetical protein [Virgibacillus halotolerans]